MPTSDPPASSGSNLRHLAAGPHDLQVAMDLVSGQQPRSRPAPLVVAPEAAEPLDEQALGQALALLIRALNPSPASPSRVLPALGMIGR